ncbi:hypothetical protein EVAR_100158_1, partial [Eumeta japonica]
MVGRYHVIIPARKSSSATHIEFEYADSLRNTSSFIRICKTYLNPYPKNGREDSSYAQNDSGECSKTELQRSCLERLTHSKGRELRRALFTLKQILQSDKDLVHEFVASKGLECLMYLADSTDPNYLDYILRALGQ